MTMAVVRGMETALVVARVTGNMAMVMVMVVTLAVVRGLAAMWKGTAPL
jgi:hypothetical protein